jgi:flagellar biosynthesis protein FliR
MPASIHFDSEALTGFLLTLTRVTATLVLLPLPGITQASQYARIILILGSTVCLMPVWQTVAQLDSNSGILGGMLFETTMGLMLGLAIAFLFETFQVASQIISFQAGFSFASTIDPQSQADSNLFQVFSQMTIGLLFFTVGIYRHLLRLLARSFTSLSPHSAHAREFSFNLILHLGTKMFVDGFKLALPVVILLFLVDQGLGALTRLQPQLQVLTLAFPAKIVLSILFLAAIMVRWSELFEHLAGETFGYLFRLLAVV